MSLLPEASIDRRLIRSAARYDTPEQMSEAVLGRLTPAQCAERVNHLITSKTTLDEVQERRLLLIQMAEHLDWMKEQRSNPKSWGALNRAYKLLSDQIERTNINVGDINTKLASRYAEYFVNGFTIGFEKALKALAEQTGHEDILELEVIEEVSRIGIEASQEYIQKVTVREDAE